MFNRVIKQNSKKFIFWGLLTEAAYLMFYLIEPLRNYIGENSITLRNTYLFLSIVVLLVLILFFYVSAHKKIVKDSIGIKTVAIFFILFNITLLFIWPIGSNDVFTYISQGRIISEHYKNPFFTAYSAFSNDSFYYLIKNEWSRFTTIYGPFFVMISAILAFAGGKSLVLSLYLFKGFFVAINIFNGYLIYKIFNSVKATFLYAWNPLILYEFSINGHNDVLVIFFILLCFYFIFKKAGNLKNYSFALFFLLLSVLIKFITIIFLPIFFLIIFFKMKPLKEKLYFTAMSFLITVFTFFILYFPFWDGPRILYKPIEQSSVFGITPFSSLLILIIAASLYYTFRININYSENLGILFGKMFFTASYLLLLIKILISRKSLGVNQVIKYFLISLSLFYASFFTWFMPWYLTVIIALLACQSALSNKIKYDRIVYGVTLYGILFYIMLR